MYSVKLYNNIAPIGTDCLTKTGFDWGKDIDNPDAILVRSADLHDIELTGKLKCIARAGAGVNNIPVDECSKRGIVVFNTPGANANAVKELTLCALFLSSRRIVDAINWAGNLKAEGDELAALIEKQKSRFAGPEIEDKKLGIIGLGAIGVMVANAAVALGMEVYGYDPYISIDAAWGLSRDVKRSSSLKEMLEICDYISLHAPLNKETFEILNAESMLNLKEGARVLNFSRGGLVCEKAMVELLNSGKVSCYATDFPSELLLGLENVIAIPHLGASTPESEDNCAKMAAREIIGYLKDGNIKNSVNLPNAELAREGDTRICIINKNVPNIVGQISTLLAVNNINIENMLNRSKKDYAYTIVDTNSDITPEVLSGIRNTGGVLSVRVLKSQSE